MAVSKIPAFYVAAVVYSAVHCKGAQWAADLCALPSGVRRGVRLAGDVAGGYVLRRGAA